MVVPGNSPRADQTLKRNRKEAIYRVMYHKIGEWSSLPSDVRSDSSWSAARTTKFESGCRDICLPPDLIIVIIC